MFTDEGKPRYWMAGYDRWHLALPVVLLALLTWLIFFPASRNVPSSGFPNPAAQPGSAPIPVPPTVVRSLAPTSVLSPHPGAVLWQGRLADVEGIAEPGSKIRLLLFDKLLATTDADDQGRFRFKLLNFHPGQFRLRVEAVSGGQTIPSPEVSFTIAPETQNQARPSTRSQPKRASKPPTTPKRGR